MFCSACGKEVDPPALFCSFCGTATNSETASADEPAFTGVNRGRMVRPRSPRMIAGVCAAFALHYGWDLNLVRVATVIFTLFWGVGLAVYLACWVIIPEAPYALPVNGN